MGISYETQQVFGWSADVGAIRIWAQKNNIEVSCNMHRPKYYLDSVPDHDPDTIEYATSKCHPSCLCYSFERDQFSFHFIGASPYYDSKIEYQEWMFGIDCYEPDIDILNSLTNIVHKDWYPELLSLVQEFGGKGGPRMLAKIHIW